MKSPAVLFVDKEKVEFGEVEVPEAGPDEVIVRTELSWISNGTEGSFLRQERTDGVNPWEPGMPKPFPMVPGYQKVGVIESLGRDVKGLSEGRRVFVSITRTLNTHLGFGGHLLRGPSPAREVIPLPEGDDPILYSGLVLTQVGYNAGARPGVREGDAAALVIGDGMVGQWAAQTLQLRGARVALIGKHDNRLAMFQGKSGDLKLKAQDADWLEKAKQWADGEFDIIVDTVGNEVNYELNVQLIPMIRHDGHYVTAGHEGSKAFMDLRPFILREATVHCPCGWTRDRMEATMRLIHEGRLQTRPLITDRLSARDASEAWHRIFTKKDSTLGVVLEWTNI